MISFSKEFLQINTDVGAFMNAVNKYGSQYVDGLTVGNEVNDAPQNIMQKVWDVRGYLNSLGYHGPISTVHTWVRDMVKYIAPN